MQPAAKVLDKQDKVLRSLLWKNMQNAERFLTEQMPSTKLIELRNSFPKQQSKTKDQSLEDRSLFQRPP